MIFIAYIGLAVEIFGMDSFKCEHYKCGVGNETKICMEQEEKGDEIFQILKPCKNTSMICNVHNKGSSKYCSMPEQLRDLYPGEYCISNSQCMSNACNHTSKICMGKNVGENCTSDSECDPKLYCSKGLCKLAQKLGDECDQELKCEVNAACGNKICVRIGSLKPDDISLSSIACSSFVSEDNKCVKGYHLHREGKESGLSCPTSGRCFYEREGKILFNSICTCGLSSGLNKYCKPGSADAKINDVSI